MEDDTNSRLEAMEKLGLCVLPFKVPYLQVHEPSGRVPVIERLQNRFVRCTRTSEAILVDKPIATICVVNSMSVGIVAEFSMVEAPSIIGLPLVGQRPLQVPFTAVLKISGTQPLTCHVDVQAFLVGEETLSRGLQWWKPPEINENLDNHNGTVFGSCIATSVCLQPEGEDEEDRNVDGGGIYVGKAEVAFDSFHIDFHNRADQNKHLLRWLIMYVNIPGTALELFTQLKMPLSIIQDAGCDAYREAIQLLWQGRPLPKRPQYVRHDLRTLTNFVDNELRTSLGIKRELEVIDVLLILQKIGYMLVDRVSMEADMEADMDADMADNNNNAANNGIGEKLMGGPETDEVVRGFDEYIRKTKALMRIIKDNYEQRSPKHICGINVGRQEAEAMLKDQTPGTFLVRFGSEGGTLVVSTLKKNGFVDHTKLTLSDLQKVAREVVLYLEAWSANEDFSIPNAHRRHHLDPPLSIRVQYIMQEWISRIEPAKFLLDASTSMRHHKEEIFGRRYRDVQDLMEAMRQGPLQDDADEGVVDSFQAEPCYDDVAVHEPTDSAIETDDANDVSQAPAVEGEQLPDLELSGLYNAASFDKRSFENEMLTTRHEIHNYTYAKGKDKDNVRQEKSHEVTMSEEDVNTTPPPFEKFGL